LILFNSVILLAGVSWPPPDHAGGHQIAWTNFSV